MGVAAAIQRLIRVAERRIVDDDALAEERFRALQRQVPLLYLVALANFAGLHLTTGGELSSISSPITALLLFVGWRLIHWLKTRDRQPARRQLVHELLKTWVYALFLACGFSVYAQILLSSSPQQTQAIVLFGSLASVGCAYGLSAFPAAARLPLLLLGFPLAVRLLSTGAPAEVGIGLSLSLVILLILRLLEVHSEGFAQLVASRARVEVERVRAREAEALASRVADTDPLTGIANRRAFMKALDERGATGRRGYAVAVLDLDGFKPINDTFGHAAGDAVLEQVAQRLIQRLGPKALIARIGGDEFALLFNNCLDPHAASEAGEQVVRCIGDAIVARGQSFTISACCGVSFVADQGGMADPLWEADTALYHAKRSHRACSLLFTPEMAKLDRRRRDIEKALPRAVGRNAIGLVFQPIRDLRTGRLRAFEALARWTDENLGEIGPSEFIPIAEQLNIIGPMSEALLEIALAAARQWPDEIKLSFNLSAVQLCTPGAGQRLAAILEDRLDPRRVQFEVTETALLADFCIARSNLDILRALGSSIVLDDFGAGHASISYLREVQFDSVKLDGSLVTSLARSPQSRPLLHGVLDLCRALNLSCVAEHIESREQLRVLRDLGCQDGQGYLLGRPVSAGAARTLARDPIARIAA